MSKKIVDVLFCIFAGIFAIIYFIALCLAYPVLVLFLGFSIDSPFANVFLHFFIFILIIIFLIYEGISISIAIAKKFKLKFSLFAFLPIVFAVIIILSITIIPDQWNRYEIQKQITANNNLQKSVDEGNFVEAKRWLIKKAILPISYKDIDLNKYNKKSRLFIYNNCPDCRGFSVLGSAVMDLNTKNKITESQINKIIYLLQEGADPNFQGQKTDTVLDILFCDIEDERAHLLLSSALIRYGFDVNIKNSIGETALMKVAYNHKIEFMKMLIENGANVNAADNDGNNALWYSMRYSCSLQCIQYLIESGININNKNKKGESAIFSMDSYLNSRFYEYKNFENEVIESLNYLKTHGMDFGLRDNQGNTAISYLKSQNKNISHIISILSEYDSNTAHAL